jgi:putative protein-disulfide isomerase
MNKPVLVYCYDAYCGWCYGFSAVIKAVAEKYQDRIRFEVLSGGMILEEEPAHISVMAGYIKEAYKTVEEYSGVRFGADYLWHIFNPGESDWYPHSEMPAIAFCIFKEHFPDQQVVIASDIQQALYAEGRDLCDPEAYRHLCERYELSFDLFFEKLHQERYKDLAKYEFAQVKQLQVTGFPTVLLQVSASKFYLVGRGYTDQQTLEARIQKVLDSEFNPVAASE